MGSYKNNKDGTSAVISTNIQVVDAPMEQFISRGEFSAVTPNDVSADNKLVAENEVTKAVNTMPTASASLVGTIVQYVGTTTANYTNGYFYKCVSDGALDPTYSWVEVISGGGGDLPWVTPQDYGAVADGVTDDTIAIQSAFDAVNTAGGGVVYFPKGVYLITPQIRIYSNTTVIGDKGESIVVTDQTYAQSKSMFQIGSSTAGAATTINVHVRGMTFRGSETYGDPQGGLGIIGIWNVKHISFVDCLFQNNRYCAMKLINASNIEIFNSRFEAVDCGVIAQGSWSVNDVTIRGCHFTGLSSYSNFTNYYSESISAFCGQNTDPCERWRIEDCIFEHKLTVGICFAATGIVAGSGHVANKNCIVRNCTFSGINGTVVAQETEDLLIDGIYFDGSTKVMPYNVHTLLDFKSSKNIIVKNVVSKCTQVSFAIVRFSDLYNSNIVIDGLDAIVPYSNTSTPPNPILFQTDANSSLKNSNIIIKNAVFRANANNTPTSAYIQYGNLENSYIDAVPYESTLVLTHYLPTTAIGKVVNNKIIVNTENNNVKRSWGTAASISVADGNEWILDGNGAFDTSGLPNTVNLQRMPKVYNITIPNKANYDASLAITDFYLMNDGYDFYIDFIASSYTVGKPFSFNKTGNIVPIDQPFIFSNDYKVVCHFVQKNAKWVEVERTLEYYEGANINILYEQELRLVTPQEYGAKGDGETDDTNAINSAIQDALANNKCVFFPSGEYLVKWSGIITNVTSDLTIFGNGYKTSVIRIDTPYTTNDSQGIIFQNGDTTKASNLTLKDIGIVYDDNDDSIVLPDDERRTVQISGIFKDILMDGVYIHIGGSATTLPSNDDIWFQCGADNIIVKNCLFENFSNRDIGGSLWITPIDADGTTVRTISQVKILNNEIRNTNRDEGIGIWQRSNDTDFNCRNVIIDGNKIIHDNWNGECYPNNNLITSYAKSGTVIDVNYVITNNLFETHKMNSQPVRFSGLNGIIFENNEVVVTAKSGSSGSTNNLFVVEGGGKVTVKSNIFNHQPTTSQCEFRVTNNDVDFCDNIINSGASVYFRNNTWSTSDTHVFNIVGNIINISMSSSQVVIRKNASLGTIFFANNVTNVGLLFNNVPVGNGLEFVNNKFNNGKTTKTITDVKGDSLIFKYNDGIILNVSDTNITTPMDSFNYIGLSGDLQFTQNGTIVPDSSTVRQAFFTANDIVYINVMNLVQLALQNSTTFDDFKALILS